MRAHATFSNTAGFFVVVTLLACNSGVPSSLTGAGGRGPSSGAGGVVVTATGSGGAGGGGGVAAMPSQHRATASVCSEALVEAGVPAEVYDGGPRGPTGPDGGPIACTSDSDCPACPNGQRDRCGSNGDVVSTLECVCDECNSDQDCGSTGVCSCGQTRGFAGATLGNVCVPSNCRVDADCGPGGFCSPTVSSSCGSFYGVQGYYCHTAADQCRNDTDCSSGAYCAFSPTTGFWICATGRCAG